MSKWIKQGLAEFAKLTGFVAIIFAITAVMIAGFSKMGVDIGYGYLTSYALFMLVVTMMSAKYKHDSQLTFEKIKTEKEKK